MPVLLKKIKRTIKRNPCFAYITYIGKYKIYNPIIRAIEIRRINRRISKGERDEDGKKILSLKNTHKGEACIIVGNGPSASIKEIDRIQTSGIDSFGANRIMDIFDKTIWRPKYISVLEPSTVLGANSTLSPDEYISIANENEIKYLFLNSRLKKFIPKQKRKSCFFLRLPLSNLFSTEMQDYSDDASFYVSDLGNVTTVSIQMATYMGYTKIYLYGMDNTYIKYLDDDGKFYNKHGSTSHMEGISQSIDDIPSNSIPTTNFQAYLKGGYSDARKMNRGFAVCHEYAEKRGVKIINLTHGGALNEFPRESFDSVFVS